MKTILFVVFLFFLAEPCFAGSPTPAEIRTKAETGDAGAQFNLGLMYHNGKGVAREYADAVKWLPGAAKQNYAAAQCLLGQTYSEGEGIPRDDTEAVKWFRKAAEQGYAPAQYCLGLMYQEGKGVPRDDVSAYMWYSLAVVQGQGQAKVKLGAIEHTMTRDQIAEAQKRRSEWKPTPLKQ
jgi:TPR repeat protein